MTDLESFLTGLGLHQYFQPFLDQGFDMLETVIDITESDLTALDVKLGHRRKLQRAIVGLKSLSSESLVHTNASLVPTNNDQFPKKAPHPSQGSDGAVQPRRYRRHPEPDDNAPERQPSAYVIFTKKIREDVRQQELSFTDTAKLVGEKWQALTIQEREPYRLQASILKELYKSGLAKYRLTQQWEDHQTYRNDLNAYTADHLSNAPKRPKLHHYTHTVKRSVSGKDAASRNSRQNSPSKDCHTVDESEISPLIQQPNIFAAEPQENLSPRTIPGPSSSDFVGNDRSYKGYIADPIPAWAEIWKEKDPEEDFQSRSTGALRSLREEHHHHQNDLPSTRAELCLMAVAGSPYRSCPADHTHSTLRHEGNSNADSGYSLSSMSSVPLSSGIDSHFSQAPYHVLDGAQTPVKALCEDRPSRRILPAPLPNPYSSTQSHLEFTKPEYYHISSSDSGTKTANNTPTTGSRRGYPD